MAKVLTVPDAEKLDIEYDEEGDVLYISFEKPSRATDSIDIDNVVFRYKEKNLIGITIIGLKERTKPGKTRSS